METQSDIMKFFQEHAKQEQKEKLERYRILNQYAEPDGILFTGSSLMEQFPVHELMLADGTHRVIYNRGVGGFTTDDMLAHMEEMVYGVSPRNLPQHRNQRYRQPGLLSEAPDGKLRKNRPPDTGTYAPDRALPDGILSGKRDRQTFRQRMGPDHVLYADQ